MELTSTNHSIEFDLGSSSSYTVVNAEEVVIYTHANVASDMLREGVTYVTGCSRSLRTNVRVTTTAEN